MVEAASLAGGLSRSAGASPVQSPRTRARLQAKAAALAADLDSQLSVALKARQRLAPSWRPEEAPAPNPRAVPLKAALPAAAVAPAPKDTVDNGTRTSSSSSARLQALERQLEELIEKLHSEQKARKAFEEELPARIESALRKAQERHPLAIQSGQAIEAKADLTSDQREELHCPKVIEMVNACEEKMQELRQEMSDHADFCKNQFISVRREIETMCKTMDAQADTWRSQAQKDIENTCQENVRTLSGSYAEVRRELAALEETWAVRLEDVRSSQDSLKMAILKDFDQAKPWHSEISLLHQELSQQIQESNAEHSKNIVACQGRLSSARLDTHDKMQAIEERLAHAEKRATEAKDAWWQGEPALRQVQTALKEVAELRDFTMDQSSKLQNSVQTELGNLAQVQTDCEAVREFCRQQTQKVSEGHDQLRLELKEAVSNARAVAEELAKELAQLKGRAPKEPQTAPSDGDMAKQLEELKEKFVTDLMACEARLHAEDSSTRQFTSEQAAQLWVSVEDLQETVQKLQGSSPSEPKENELSVEEVKQFETVKMTSSVLSEGNADVRPEPASGASGAPSSIRQHREELLQRLSKAQSRLEQQHGLVQKQKEDLEQMQRKF